MHGVEQVSEWRFTFRWFTLQSRICRRQKDDYNMFRSYGTVPPTERRRWFLGAKNSFSPVIQPDIHCPRKRADFKSNYSWVV